MMLKELFLNYAHFENLIFDNIIFLSTTYFSLFTYFFLWRSRVELLCLKNLMALSHAMVDLGNLQ